MFSTGQTRWHSVVKIGQRRLYVTDGCVRCAKEKAVGISFHGIIIHLCSLYSINVGNGNVSPL